MERLTKCLKGYIFYISVNHYNDGSGYKEVFIAKDPQLVDPLNIFSGIDESDSRWGIFSRNWLFELPINENTPRIPCKNCPKSAPGCVIDKNGEVVSNKIQHRPKPDYFDY